MGCIFNGWGDKARFSLAYYHWLTKRESCIPIGWQKEKAAISLADKERKLHSHWLWSFVCCIIIGRQEKTVISLADREKKLHSHWLTERKLQSHWLTCPACRRKCCRPGRRSRWWSRPIGTGSDGTGGGGGRPGVKRAVISSYNPLMPKRYFCTST